MPRDCPAPGPRSYRPRYEGIGFELLDSESEVCFVSDDQYRLLDDIIDDVQEITRAHAPYVQAADALKLSNAVADTLSRRGFVFYTPTDAFSDTMVRRGTANSVYHVFDCDTSTLIYLTVAEALGIPATMVEVVWPFGDQGHNYVRWFPGTERSFDWDTNGRATCVTPSGQPPAFGRAMTRTEVLGYFRSVRAKIFEREGNYDAALDDYREARKAYPNSVIAANNIAWIIATKSVAGRDALKSEALALANYAVALHDKPNHLDTLACVQALLGNFDEAIAIERKAISREPTQSFADRLAAFMSGRDCTGFD